MPTPEEQKLLSAGVKGDCEDIAKLIDAGVSVDCTDMFGQTPLVMAVMNARFDACKLLLERGASATVTDKWGRSPLDHAKQWANRSEGKTFEGVELPPAEGKEIAYGVREDTYQLLVKAA